MSWPPGTRMAEPWKELCTALLCLRAGGSQRKAESVSTGSLQPTSPTGTAVAVTSLHPWSHHHQQHPPGNAPGHVFLHRSPGVLGAPGMKIQVLYNNFVKGNGTEDPYGMSTFTWEIPQERQGRAAMQGVSSSMARDVPLEPCSSTPRAFLPSWWCPRYSGKKGKLLFIHLLLAAELENTPSATHP